MSHRCYSFLIIQAVEEQFFKTTKHCLVSNLYPHSSRLCIAELNTASTYFNSYEKCSVPLGELGLYSLDCI